MQLWPRGGSGGEIPRRGPNDAETLSRRRFHDPPSADLLDALRAQVLEPDYLSFDIVGFDVQMHAAGMAHNLYFDLQVVLRVLEFLVNIALAVRRRQRPHCHAERSAPEIRGRVEISCLAIDDEPGQFAFVHFFPQICGTH
jgi:hypothetical protein